MLHDVWVEYNPTTGRWEGVLSYWDAGFITVDLTDPANPTYLADSDYLDQDPILAEERAAFDGRPEGNAHAAVFGGDANEFIFGGDEDFDATAITVNQGGLAIAANDGSDTPAPSGESGPVTFVGEACGAVPTAEVPTVDGETPIALIERGTCAFTTKATNITEAGYKAGIVFNSAANGCDAGIGMLVAGTVPMVSISRGDGYALMGLDCADENAVPTIGATFDALSLGSSFVGWGYFWALNNSDKYWTVPGTPTSKEGETIVEPMGTLGYYAPAEIADPGLASGAGDLTMHNLETDVAEDGRERTFISWYALGMRAVEWRKGHFHNNTNGEGSYSWNIHEVGRWIASEDDPAVQQFAQDAGVDAVDLSGSNFWGVTQFVDEKTGIRYVLGSDRNTGLWVFTYDCDSDPDADGPLYCGVTNGG